MANNQFLCVSDVSYISQTQFVLEYVFKVFPCKFVGARHRQNIALDQSVSNSSSKKGFQVDDANRLISLRTLSSTH